MEIGKYYSTEIHVLHLSKSYPKITIICLELEPQTAIMIMFLNCGCNTFLLPQKKISMWKKRRMDGLLAAGETDLTEISWNKFQSGLRGSAE